MTWLRTKIGKRRALMISTAVSIVGYALKWVSYNPDVPWLVILPAPPLAFELGGLFTLVPAMLADVNATGFDVDLGGDQTDRTLFLMRLFDVGIPMLSSALAIWAAAAFPITKARPTRFAPNSNSGGARPTTGPSPMLGPRQPSLRSALDSGHPELGP